MLPRQAAAIANINGTPTPAGPKAATGAGANSKKILNMAVGARGRRLRKGPRQAKKNVFTPSAATKESLDQEMEDYRAAGDMAAS
jgi:hypothetical protein